MISYFCPTCKRILRPEEVFGRNEPPDDTGNRPQPYHRVQIYFAHSSLMDPTAYIPVCEQTHPILASIDGVVV